MSGRAVIERRTVHVHDVLAAAEEYPDSFIAREIGLRTRLSTPLLRDGVPIGVFALSRTEVAPYSDRQIALIETFADQAVIAIENARLFAELQVRTRELTRSVERLQALFDVRTGRRLDARPRARAADGGDAGSGAG
jgi:GAF domain-containing protein